MCSESYSGKALIVITYTRLRPTQNKVRTMAKKDSMTCYVIQVFFPCLGLSLSDNSLARLTMCSEFYSGKYLLFITARETGLNQQVHVQSLPNKQSTLDTLDAWHKIEWPHIERHNRERTKDRMQNRWPNDSWFHATKELTTEDI